MSRLAACALGATLLVAAPGVAWPCGSSGGSDSGGSSSGGSSGGSSDSSSSSSSSSDSEPACVEVSSVVGRSQCSWNRFGRWNVARVPRIAMRIGTSVHSFSAAAMSFAGQAAHGDGIAYRMVGGELTSDPASAVTVDLGVTARFGRYAYAGVEGQIGRAMVDTRMIERDSGLQIDSSASIFSQSGVVAGVAVPVGNLSLRAEALVGARLVGLSVTSRHADCVDDSMAFDWSLLVEPRVSAETWLSPWMSAGVQVGSNVAGERDMSVGVFLRGHTRAFDATRPR